MTKTNKSKLFSLSFKIENKLEEINIRMNELERTLPYLNNKEFYKRRINQLNEIKKVIIKKAKSFEDEINDML